MTAGISARRQGIVHDSSATRRGFAARYGIESRGGTVDPSALPYAINNVRELTQGDIPMFGICLGHQILGLALGAETYKLKFGHRGANHPVKELESGKVEITSQNHGFAVDLEQVGECDG